MPDDRRANSQNERLLPSFYPFLIMISCFSVVSMAYSTFLNTFLMHATGDSRSVMVFNIILAACQPVSMIAAVFTVRRLSAVLAQRIGLGLIVLSNLYLFLAVENAIDYIYAVAAIQSVANGFYFTTYACQYVNYTTNSNRDKAAGLTNMVANILSLAFSMGSSLLFSVRPGYPGYRLLFLFALALSLVAFAISFPLAPLSTVNAGRRVYYIYAVKTLWKNRYARSSMVITLLDGVRVGIMAFYLNVLLYSMIDSETLIGINTFLSTLAGVLASAAYARFISMNRRYLSARISITAMLAATVLLGLGLSPATIIVYSFINGFMLPFYSTPLLNAYWTVLERLPELNDCRPETHAAREIYYAAGRVLGIVFTMALPSSDISSVCVLAGIIGVQYIGLILSRKILRDIDKIPV